jgi:serine/threonine protein kinase
LSQPMSGQTVSRYRILGRLAAGGMGEVYRGRDEKLDRATWR